MSPQQEAELFDRMFALEAYAMTLGAYLANNGHDPAHLTATLNAGLDRMIKTRSDMPAENESRIRDQFEKIVSSIAASSVN
ncbi:hypothetical protein [Oceanospirillum linum]|uniref:Uncharacterized protein n=1 Tax=Oceanospirillum linum TaxID=966 RepID=A0A1T1HCE1_OCELI|nr:hypothetical protein [Oceanospirillum linum]OOV87466.1 hypothetical protein BTA35_0205320 [Oceanospirillum linum]SEF88803.1 hypothetical protein SAMN04489856_10330 [Oleiphilus messinensis]SMP13676.1 hypothetical protein SAMN06264348_102510 [Oceanospirillum linum]